MGEPWLRCMLLTLRAMTMATGMLDTVVSFTAWALREAVAVMAALAIADSAEGLAVHGGEVGGAFQICWRKGVKDIAEGGHGRSPYIRVLRRSEASSCPLVVRCREIMVVASWGCPKERWMRRGCTPASRRWVAYACRRVGMATPVLVMPARCVAVRKAPWTLL